MPIDWTALTKMGARGELENYILNSWQDRRVARWVIGRMSLLERGFTHPPCSIFSLSLDGGLIQEFGEISCEDFRHTPKIVISGGLEGTAGHIHAVKELNEIRAIIAKPDALLVLMLEPDSFIAQQKGRDPVVNLERRRRLWSTSGLADAVITLPERKSGVSVQDHYLQIHELIKPAMWCTNVENPHWFEIITRGHESGIDIVRLLKHIPEVHSSFLSSTKNLSRREVKRALWDYVLGLVEEDGIYTMAIFCSPAERAKIVWEYIAKGL